jgi:hypothetical protein
MLSLGLQKGLSTLCSETPYQSWRWTHRHEIWVHGMASIHLRSIMPGKGCSDTYRVLTMRLLPHVPREHIPWVMRLASSLAVMPT